MRAANAITVAEAWRRGLLGGKKKPRILVAPADERTVDGHRFASKKEADAAAIRLMARKSGRFWSVAQPTFLLPGGRKARFDFLDVEPLERLLKPTPMEEGTGWVLARVRVVDVKGRRTPSYIRNVKEVLAIYGVEVEEA